MVPLIGYVDWFSARPGERIAVKVSSRLTEPYQADLVRIVHGDANPAGPGLKFEEVAAAFAGPTRRGFSRFIPDRMGLWRPKVENDYDKDVYNGDLGIVSRIDLMGPRTTNLRLEAIAARLLLCIVNPSGAGAPPPCKAPSPSQSQCRDG